MPLSEELNLNKITALAALKSRFLDPEEYLLLVRQAGQPGRIRELSPETPAACEFAASLSSKEFTDRLHAAIRDWEKRGIGMLVYGEHDYPAKLNDIFNPPPVIFYRGDPQALPDDPALSIVGSRKADGLGCDFARSSAQYAAEGGVKIISGLALGVDAAAHAGALAGGNPGATIAVLGNGLNTVYPSSNSRLADAILAQGGLLLSQFLPETPPYPSNFLDRNRIIAGLSDAVLVIQAPARSGSLSTARHALEEGRDVLALPGAVNDPRYTGSNLLIQKGAHVILSKEDLTDFFPAIKNRPRQKSSSDTPAISAPQKKLAAFISSRQSLHFTEIKKEFPTSPTLSTDLLELEMKAVITRLPGNFYSRKIT